MKRKPIKVKMKLKITPAFKKQLAIVKREIIKLSKIEAYTIE
jgi:hypothetical protein